MALRTSSADPMRSILEATSGIITASKRVLMLVEHRRCFFALPKAFVALIRSHVGVDLGVGFQFLDIWGLDEVVVCSCFFVERIERCVRASSLTINRP
jgi:hypothetical protein